MTGQEPMIRHLEMIQSCVQRMETFSRHCKTLAFALLLAAVVFPSESWTQVGVSYAIAVVLWLFDSKYLHYERRFRKHYDCVRNAGPDASTNFNLELCDQYKDDPSFWGTALSWSCLLFHIPIAAGVVLAQLPI